MPYFFFLGNALFRTAGVALCSSLGASHGTLCNIAACLAELLSQRLVLLAGSFCNSCA